MVLNATTSHGSTIRVTLSTYSVCPITFGRALALAIVIFVNWQY